MTQLDYDARKESSQERTFIDSENVNSTNIATCDGIEQDTVNETLTIVHEIDEKHLHLN